MADYTLVDTTESVADMIDTLSDLPVNPPSLYIDLEGVNLSRMGTVSILQLFVLPQQKTYLVDICVLKESAFLTKGTKGQSLKGILESETIPKAFFDIRNDSDAMYSHFGINVACIEDIQLMELATRAYNRRFVKGLSKCIENDVSMAYQERRAWNQAKDEGKKLFAPELGGSYEVFNARPLDEQVALYCAQDVQILPRLWSHYNSKINIAWAEKVRKATRDRIVLSQSATYNGKGRKQAEAPPGWA